MASTKTKKYKIADTNTNPKYIGKNSSLQEISKYNNDRKVKKPTNNHPNKPKPPSIRDLVMQLLANDKIIFSRLDKLEANDKVIFERLDRIEERLDKNDIRMKKIEERLDKNDIRLEKIEQKLDEYSEIFKRNNLH
jgi:hypothetical protein